MLICSIIDNDLYKLTQQNAVLQYRQGVPVRYVELPYEGHHYWARESVLHAAAEMIDWLNRTIGPDASPPK